jgi:hypothetical protein
MLFCHECLLLEVFSRFLQASTMLFGGARSDYFAFGLQIACGPFSLQAANLKTKTFTLVSLHLDADWKAVTCRSPGRSE